MKKVTILGSTGSIGVNTLGVIENNLNRFKVVALAAGKNINLLQKQIEKFHPEIVAVADYKSACKLRKIIPTKLKIKIVGDEEGVNEVASFNAANIVVSAISGAAGLVPTLTAIESGKDIALANKETMVMAGEIITRKAGERGIKILPVDSEHSAIFQCLQGQKHDHLQKIILTASGGPFLDYTREKMAKVKLADTLRHPNWKMGKKITIDSASMMNKGLEVIEAKWLFNLDINKINVLIHPQSVVHSMVEFVDGSVIAQMGIPDMRIPIAYALSYPERLNNNLPNLNLLKIRSLEFRKPDLEKFPCLRLAYEAANCGGTMPVVLNAANEVAVEAFIRKKINFVDLPGIIDKVMNAHKSSDATCLDDILQVDKWARQNTKKRIERITI